MAKTIMVDIDNTIADYTNGLRDYIRECGCGEEDYPCPEPTAYDFTLTVGWPFNGYYNGDKTLLTPDVLIDDRPVTLEAMTAKGVTVLHPDHAYCTAAPGRMFHRWAAVPLILGGLE